MKFLDDDIPFEPEELGEVLLIAYKVLEWTIRDCSDEVSLNSEGYIWKKAGTIKGHFPSPPREPSMSYREALQLIFERDEKVREHFILFSETDAEIIYKVKGH